jgi:pyruvate,water dikinase
MAFLSKYFRRNKVSRPNLDVRIACFREVLHANNAALGFIAEIQEALEATGPLAASDISRMAAGVTVQTFRMVSNLVRMTGEKRHRELIPRFNNLKKSIAEKIGPTPVLKPSGFVVPLVDVSSELSEAVGMKSAYLGEARRILQGYVPDGFATTVEAFQAFMSTDGLGARIASAMDCLRDGDVASCFEASARIVQMVEACRVPDEVAGALETAVTALAGSPEALFAVRSSALQEGGPEMSFAGQYRSVLNIPRDGVVDAFRRVIASKYSPQAIVYRAERGFNDAEVAMCCCVISMVDAAAAGVMYTSFPTSSGNKSILQAVRGLGLAAVDGSAEPDTFMLDRSTRKVLDAKIGMQNMLFRSSPYEGTEKVSLNQGERRNPAEIGRAHV